MFQQSQLGGGIPMPQQQLGGQGLQLGSYGLQQPLNTGDAKSDTENKANYIVLPHQSKVSSPMDLNLNSKVHLGS